MHKDHSLALENANETDFAHDNMVVGGVQQELQWQPLSAFDISKVFISSNQLVTTLDQQKLKSPSQAPRKRGRGADNNERHKNSCATGGAASNYDRGASHPEMEVMLNA